MKNLLKLEELAMLVISIYALYLLRTDWWFYGLLLIGPDISMIGYFAGNKTGAFFYTLFHHKAIAIIIFLAGMMNDIWLFQATGAILFGHSSLDRMFGYGLKYFESFQHTHLGRIGSNK